MYVDLCGMPLRRHRGLSKALMMVAAAVAVSCRRRSLSDSNVSLTTDTANVLAENASATCESKASEFVMRQNDGRGAR